MPVVTVIPATINPLTRLPSMSTQKRKVAAYARVSTDSDEQFTSYEAQIDYYTKFITENPSWEFVGVYADEGISGTNTKHREEFKRMISDAYNGKIDLIVTKSVSRFARNTVDSLTTIRSLKEHGCECFFQKENIYTFDSQGELLLTIMSSLAQEESRSISENVTWGHRKRFADGKIMLAYKHFLGYERGEDGLPSIVEEEAEIVRRIYRLFAEGKTPAYIAKELTQAGVLTPGGKEKWRSNTVMSILTNEKYRGSAILQKSFTVDFLTKKKKKNEGEVPQYYVEDSHPPIIEPEEWDWVQNEIKRRQAMEREYSCSSIFSAKIVCGDCGNFYGSKVWHSKDKYRKTVWQCNRKFDKEIKCTTPHLNENDIKTGFIVAFNHLVNRKGVALDACKTAVEVLTDTMEIERKILEAQQERDIVVEMIERCVSENASVAMKQDEYQERYTALTTRYKEAEAALNALVAEKKQRIDKAKNIASYMRQLASAEHPIESFDDKLWLLMVSHVVVEKNGELTFVFKDDTKIVV